MRQAPRMRPFERKNATPTPRRKRDDVWVNDDAMRGSAAELTRSHRPASLVPSSWSDEHHTFEAVFSTGAAVRRRDRQGVYVERLDLSDLDVAPLEGLPVLDNHRQGSARDLVGIVQSARLENGHLVGVIRLGVADDIAPIAARARDGLLSVSIGYFETSRADSSENGERVRTITPRIFEVSLVAVPADNLARIRSAPMEDETLDTLDTAMSEADESAIRSMGELFDLPPSAADSQIEAGATVADARIALRSLALDERRQRSASTRIRVQNAGPSPDQTRAAREEAIACRMSGATPSEAARPFMSLRLQDHAADSLQAAGISTRGLSADDVFVRAGTHTTSDFPLLVSNAMGKVAQEAYKAAESPLRILCRQRNLSNFKQSTAIRLGELGRLEPLSESGEFRHTTRAENGEAMALETYGRAINVSRKLLIDDDLNLLGDMNAAFGEAAAQTEAEVLLDVLTSNPKMADGKSVFHATRGNIGAASDITIASLNEARKALRGRKGLDGRTLISATPKYLLVGPDRETEAEAMLAELAASTIADVNPFAGKLQLLVEPRIEDGRWYVFADPARLPSLQFGYLASAPGVQIQRAEAWDVLGAKFRAWLDFGAGWLDWRGVQTNAGA